MSKKLKLLVTSLVIILVVFVGWDIWKSLSWGKRRVAYEVERTKNLESIAQLGKEKTVAFNDANKWKEEADSYKGEAEKVKEELEKKRVVYVEVVKAVEELEPSEVVRDVREHLQVEPTEVRQVSTGVEFSLSATRKVLKIMIGYDFHLHIEIPKWKSIAETRAKEVKAKEKEAISLREALAKSNKQVTGLLEQSVKDHNALEDCENQIGRTVVKVVIYTTAGVVVVYVIVRGISLLIGGK